MVDHAVAHVDAIGGRSTVCLLPPVDGHPRVPMARVIAWELDVLGSHGMAAADYPAMLSLIEQGKLRALGVTTPKRSGVLPQVPPIAEAGLPGYEMSGWIGLLAPAKTPPAVSSSAMTSSRDGSASSPTGRTQPLPGRRSSPAGDTSERLGPRARTHFISTFDAEQEAEIACHAMEYISGVTVDEVIKGRRPEISEVCSIAG